LEQLFQERAQLNERIMQTINAQSADVCFTTQQQPNNNRTTTTTTTALAIGPLGID
jgi:hypothetical protein